MGASYRLRQVLATLDRRVPHDRIERALRGLNPEERALFRRLRPVDQRHTLAVYTAALAVADDPALSSAALLHDVGKGRPALLERVALTILAWEAPWLLIRWQRLPTTSWRGRVGRLVAHSEHSARLAELAGSAAEVVATIRAYGQREHPRGRRLAELDATR